MHYHLTLAAATALLSVTAPWCCAADMFRPIGTEQYFVVDAEVLKYTPRWDPDDGDVPLTAIDAVKVATKYHETLRFTGFMELHRWAFHRAILARGDGGNWYWNLAD